MSSAGKTLLVTSINPFSNLAFQLRCFHRWKTLGFDVQTVNVREEVKLLRGRGIGDEDIKLIDDGDSGRELFGKPVPLIKPLIDSLERDQSHDRYLISNSDIFPALRSRTIVDFWERTCNSGLALTRDECHALEAHSYPDEAPYRGGLDIFFMTHGALRRVSRQLGELKAAKRMAFGIPGWDYLMGAAMLSPKVGGAILDSRTLLHVSHRPSYGSMDEFRHYLADMTQLGYTASNNPSVAAADFAARIDTECEKNLALSRTARLLYFSPAPDKGKGAGFDQGRSLDIFTELLALAPQFEGQYRGSAIRSLINRLAADPDAHLGVALGFLLSSPSKFFRFTQALFAISLALRCKSNSGPMDVTEQYPKGNQHAAALRNILDRHPETDPSRRLEVAKLFGSELVDHRILNRRLYKYLALCCDNKTERALLLDICGMTRIRKNVD